MMAQLLRLEAPPPQARRAAQSISDCPAMNCASEELMRRLVTCPMGNQVLFHPATILFQLEPVRILRLPGRRVLFSE